MNISEKLGLNWAFTPSDCTRAACMLAIRAPSTVHLLSKAGRLSAGQSVHDIASCFLLVAGVAGVATLPGHAVWTIVQLSLLIDRQQLEPECLISDGEKPTEYWMCARDFWNTPMRGLWSVARNLPPARTHFRPDLQHHG